MENKTRLLQQKVPLSYAFYCITNGTPPPTHTHTHTPRFHLCSLERCTTLNCYKCAVFKMSWINHKTRRFFDFFRTIKCSLRMQQASKGEGMEGWRQERRGKGREIGGSAFSRSSHNLQLFDWNKFPLQRTLANEDSKSRSLQCPL